MGADRRDVVPGLRSWRLVVLFALGASLSACGGGGGDDPAAPAPPGDPASPAPPPSAPPPSAPPPSAPPPPAPPPPAPPPPAPPPPATGAASDCFNLALAQVGTTYRWDWQVLSGGTVVGTASFDASVVQTTTFEGIAGLSETQANVSTTVQSGGTTVANAFTLLDYSSVTGSTLTQYGQITTSPSSGTTRDVWSPPRADTRAALALGASTDVAWTSRATLTPTGGAAQPTQITAYNNRITYRGQESVTVPAGTFAACRFDIIETPGNRERIEWVAVGTGAQVKTTSSPGTASEGSVELLGTSRLNGNPL